MNRRTILLSLPAALAGLTGCSDDRQWQQLMESLKDTSGNLDALVGQLQDDVDDFDDEDWKDVVPEVRRVAQMLAQECESLRVKLGIEVGQ